MGMPRRAECLVVLEQRKQGMGRDRVRRAEEGKHRDQLHEKGVYGINTFLTLSHNYTTKENKQSVGYVPTSCTLHEQDYH